MQTNPIYAANLMVMQASLEALRFHTQRLRDASINAGNIRRTQQNGGRMPNEANNAGGEVQDRVSPATKIAFTSFIPSTGRHVGKQIKADGTKVQHDFGSTQFKATRMNMTLRDLAMTFRPNHFITYGVFDEAEVLVVPQGSPKTEGAKLPIRNRASEQMPAPIGPGLMTIDNDFLESSGPTLAMLEKVIPTIGLYNHLIKASSGSNILTDSFDQLRGRKGEHVMFACKSGIDVAHNLEVIHKLLIIAGIEHCYVGAAGQFLERTVVDQALRGSQQPIFSAASLEAGLYQDLDVVVVDGPLLPRVPDLTDAQQAAYKEARAAIEFRLKPEMAKQKSACIQARVAEGWTHEAATQAVDSGRLKFAAKITLSDGVVLSVAELLADRDKYHGRTTFDPLEPEYRDSATVGKLFLNHDRPNLHSRAHGGKTYWLDVAAEDDFAEELGGGISKLGPTVEEVEAAVAEVEKSQSNDADSNVGLHPHAIFLAPEVDNPRDDEYVLDQMICGGASLVVGSAGVGKTTQMVPLACITAHLCDPAEPLKPELRRKVIYITEDVGQVRKIIRSMRLDGWFGDISENEVAAHLKLVAAKRMTAAKIAEVTSLYSTMTVTNTNPNTGDTYEAKPWIIWDTSNANIALESENDNAEVGEALATLKENFTQKGFPTTLVTHFGKAAKRADISEISSRGASAFEADVNQVMYLVEDDVDSKKRWLEIGSVHTKHRFDAAADGISFSRVSRSVPMLSILGNLIDVGVSHGVPVLVGKGERVQQREAAKVKAVTEKEGEARAAVVTFLRDQSTPVSRTAVELAGQAAGQSRNIARMVLGRLITDGDVLFDRAYKTAGGRTRNDGVCLREGFGDFDDPVAFTEVL